MYMHMHAYRIIYNIASTIDAELIKVFWFVRERGEKSQRVFDLTTRIIQQCEGHYTVW